MIERLYIDNTYIPLSKSINTSLTKSITDITKPDTRKATYSKSTRIPNSPEANKVFGSIFEIDLVDGTFNPSVKVDVLYEVDGEPILEGYLQLKKIVQVDNKDIEYEVVMFGTVANIFRDMGEKYLNDADMIAELDEWDHPFTKEIQQKSWATEVWNNDSSSFVPFALGTGYVYPLADFGLQTDLTNYPYYLMPCCLYVKEYIDAIFDSNGYSYTSNFFNSTYFKSLIIPNDPRSNQLTGSEIANLQFSANTPELVSTGTSTSNAITPGSSFTAIDKIICTNEISDPGGVYNPATGEYTITVTEIGNYDVNFLFEVNATFTPSTGAAVVTTSDIQGGIYVYINGVQQVGIPFYITYGDLDLSSFTSGARTTNTNPSYPSARVDHLTPGSVRFSLIPNTSLLNLVERTGVNGKPNQYLLTLNNGFLANGDVITIQWKARYQGLGNNPARCFADNLGTFYDGTATLDFAVGAYYNKVNNQYPTEGIGYKIEKAIPPNIKQKDFFISIVKMFNLWIDIDPDDPRNYIIEPRDEFLGTDVIDIQGKLAQDKDLELIPMGKTDAAEYYFTYKPDKDFLNEEYTYLHNRVYGDRYVNNVNEFVTKTQKTEVIFSPTTMSAPPNSNRVLPTVVAQDDVGQSKPVNHNIRIWYYGGLKTGTAWNHINFSPLNGFAIPTTYTTYPFAGHMDDPYTWTEDLNWGLVNEVFYDDNITPIVVTDNNLVNKYYGEMLQQYNSKNSKICTAYFNVTPSDFRAWDFSKLYWFENNYWRLQKIESYNPTGEDLTKCVFLLLTDIPSFSNTPIDADGSDDPVASKFAGGDLDFGETKPAKGTHTAYNNNQNNFANYTTNINGAANYVDPTATYVDIQGDSNVVNGGAKNVVIQGDGNIVEPGLQNVTLINTSNVTVTENDTTYINGKLISGEGSWVTKTSDFTTEASATGYYLDGSITATLLVGADGYDWIFKNVGTDIATIQGDIFAGDTIDGELSQKLDPSESFRVRWNPDEGEYNIIN